MTAGISWGPSVSRPSGWVRYHSSAAGPRTSPEGASDRQHTIIGGGGVDVDDLLLLPHNNAGDTIDYPGIEQYLAQFPLTTS
ncbi:hypothetical protein [Rhodococcus tibetensis]|uniref:Uncharacterized protein n=1 Tax=Rhodococcus tibetensis TaxID=2965064 RepID=A0ABT1QEG9_9NOCA|nr:hypothetical protein [Rhodococcus sp. FXJ9.536]MCQ4120587.1 hypothetical protein [Rhodococcus sp. FXJ9.536]